LPVGFCGFLAVAVSAAWVGGTTLFTMTFFFFSFFLGFLSPIWTPPIPLNVCQHIRLVPEDFTACHRDADHRRTLLLESRCLFSFILAERPDVPTGTYLTEKPLIAKGFKGLIAKSGYNMQPPSYEIHLIIPPIRIEYQTFIRTSISGSARKCAFSDKIFPDKECIMLDGRFSGCNPAGRANWIMMR
jgi:hypothetical protein